MKTKFNLDREPLESDYIQSKRDFNKVVKGYKASSYPVWKRPWFYGPTGAAAFALILSMTIFNENELNEQTNTLATSVTQLDDLEDTPCVHPPSEENDLAFRVFTIQAGKDEHIELPSGTIIDISNESLQATGEVQLMVREFSNKSEVFLAGVPMDYQNEAFESAGMIEIRAVQKNEAVEINETSPIKVSMVQTKAGEGFGFWYLDEAGKKWVSHPVEQVSSKRDLNLEESKCLDHLSKVDDKIVIVEEQITALKQPNPKAKMLPKEGSKKLMVDFDVADFPEFKSLKGVEFEYLNYSNALSQKLKSGTWTKVDLQKSRGYLVEFSNSRESVSVPVKPVLSGKQLKELQDQLAIDRTQKEADLAEIALEKKQLEKERQKLQIKLEKLQLQMKSSLAQQSNTASEREKYMNRQAARNNVEMATRSEFSATRWGLFNCDQPIPYPKAFPEPREFVDVNGATINVQNAYVFDQKKDVRYSFGVSSGRGLNEIGWNKSNSTMVVVDDFGRIYVAQKVNELDGQTRTVRFQALDLSNLDASQLEKILNDEVVLA